MEIGRLRIDGRLVVRLGGVFEFGRHRQVEERGAFGGKGSLGGIVIVWGMEGRNAGVDEKDASVTRDEQRESLSLRTASTVQLHRSPM